MKKANILFSLLAIGLFIISSAFAQGRGQGSGRPAGIGAPSNPGSQGNRPSNPGQSTDHRLENSGRPESPGKSADHKPDTSAHAVDKTDTHGFKNYGQYVAAEHVSEHLGVTMEALTTQMVTNKLSLGEAIKQLRPDLNNQQIQAETKKAEEAGKKAEAQAKKSGKQT